MAPLLPSAEASSRSPTAWREIHDRGVIELAGLLRAPNIALQLGQVALQSGTSRRLRPAPRE
ncbi:MAG: hypothetical protein WDO74_01445 [Pseudomonadota bacterium]